MSGTTTHIPAWRKLGLKLKYAQGQAEPPGSAPVSEKPNQTIDPRKRSPPPTEVAKVAHGSAPGTTVEHRPAKRQKASKKSESARQEECARTTDHAPPTQPDVPLIEDTKRRKSVTFSSDTKTEDGQGTKELYDKWERDQDTEFGQMSAQEALEFFYPDAKQYQPPRNALSEPTNKPANSAPSEPPSNPPSGTLVKRKRDKKSRSTLLGAGVSSTLAKTKTVLTPPGPSQSLLDYLSTYYKSREHWKFNKARQNQLFKAVFDLEKIPPSHDNALIAYIKGLQGSAARNSLRERALAVRKRDLEDGLTAEGEGEEVEMKDAKSTSMSTDEARQHTAYRYALKRHKGVLKRLAMDAEEEDLQQSVEWEKRLRKRVRAEDMLRELGEEVKETVMTPVRMEKGIDYELQRNVPETIVGANGIVTEKRKRKRKRRTAVPIDDSSSDETSSDEDSGEDNEDKMVRNALTMELGKKTKVEVEDDTSSSESDESDSQSSGGSDDEMDETDGASASDITSRSSNRRTSEEDHSSSAGSSSTIDESDEDSEDDRD